MKVLAKKSTTVIEIISCLYAFLFTYAAVSKFLDYENFVVQLGTSPMLSAYANSVAWLVPIVEIALSIALLIKTSRFVALFYSYILMCLFTAYIFIILNYSAFVPCSCGGILEKLGWKEHLVFNVIFIILCLLY